MHCFTAHSVRGNDGLSIVENTEITEDSTRILQGDMYADYTI